MKSQGRLGTHVRAAKQGLLFSLLLGSAAQAQSYACDGRADLWFLNDESGSVNSTEWAYSKSFLQDVTADFDFDSADGFQGSLWAWSNNTYTRISPSNDLFPSVVSSYSRAGSGSTYPGIAVQAVAAQVADTTEVPPGSGVTDDGRRVGIPQIVVLLTDADGDHSVTGHPGGIRDGSLLVSSGNSIRASGGEVVIYAIAEAAGRYDPSHPNYEPSFKTLLDNAAGGASNVIVGSTYADIALDPQYVDDLTDRICAVADTLTPENPAITGDMSATITTDTGPAGLSAGDTVTFSIEITNTGDVDLTDVDIQDTTLTRVGGSVISGFVASNFTPTGSTTLTPTANTTFVADYVVTQADIDAGGLVNTATVIGTPPSGAANNVTDVTDDGDDSTDGDDAGTDPTDDPVELLVSAAPELTVTQIVSGTNLTLSGDPVSWEPGDEIIYTVEVTNSGNVTISDLEITGPLLPSDVVLTSSNTVNTSGPAGSGADTGDDALEPNEAWSFTYSYTVVQSDIDAGEVLSTVEITGQDPSASAVSDGSDGDGDPGADSPRDADSQTGNDPNVTTLPAGGEVSIRKTVDDTALDDGVDEGDVLLYEITIQNTGNVTLSAFELTDFFEDGAGNPIALDTMQDDSGGPLAPTGNPDGSATYFPSGDLAPGDSWTLTAEYTVTSDVMATGGVENMVVVEADTPSGDTVEAESRVVDNTSSAGPGVPTGTGFPGSVTGQVMEYHSGLDGIDVRLIDEASNTMVDTTTTAGGGYYEFINVTPGTYTVEFDNPSGSGAEPTAQSADYAEDGNRITGIVVSAGQVEADQNAFLIDPSGVIYDAETFAPIAGATVTLLFNGAPVPDTWLDDTFGDLNNVQTGSDGTYSFFLDPAIAQSGSYTLEVAHASYVFESTLIPATVGPYTPALGGGAEQISPLAVPASGMDTTYFLNFNLAFAPGNPAATSNGIVNNHIPLDANLIDGIQQDLLRVLEDDLAATMTQLGRQMEGYAAGALQRLQSRDHLACLAQVSALLEQENIHFDTDKATIRPESDVVLDELATILGTCPGGYFEIAGHTDNRASDDYNMRLSQARADAVISALAERGVVTDGFVGQGYGERRPIASNDTEEGMARNRRVEFVLLGGENEVGGVCRNTTDTSGSARLNKDANGLNFAQDLLSESYDCRNDSWSIFEGRVGFFETDAGVSQTLANLSYRRERFVNLNRVQGYFLGVYGSENNVTGLATGSIQGLGFNGGIYGANRFNETLYVDYYLGGATGRHNFDLDFDRTGGAINANGNYTYIAGFVGTALSGRTQLSNVNLTPRAGVDLAYSPGGDVDLTASRGALEQSSSLRLGSVNGGRLFAELGIQLPTRGRNGYAAIVPRVSCYQAIGTLNGACGFGGAIDLGSTNRANGSSQSIRLEGERGPNFTTGAITARYARYLWGGTLTGDASVSDSGDLTLVQKFELLF